MTAKYSVRKSVQKISFILSPVADKPDVVVGAKLTRERVYIGRSVPACIAWLEIARRVTTALFIPIFNLNLRIACWALFQFHSLLLC